MKKYLSFAASTALSLGLSAACAKEAKAPNGAQGSKMLDAQGAPAANAVIDRFSDSAGHLQKRSAQPALPAADAPVDFDQAPFITQGFGPDGDYVSYYNFDVQSTTPAPIYVLFKAGANAPVEGQHNIVDAIPGDSGYSDFWNVKKVTVADDYVADSITSLEELRQAGFVVEDTQVVVNCPIVPAGSTATKRFAQNADTGLHQGWYKGSVVNYFNFSEKDLSLTAAGGVPVSPIFVTFNKNPDPNDATSGPASGFKVDAVTGRTHNVTATTPAHGGYSPLWSVSVYDNQSFATVHDFASVISASELARGVANVNCPIVEKSSAPAAGLAK